MTKTVRVKGVALLARYPDPDNPFIEEVWTFGSMGRHVTKSDARSNARTEMLEGDKIVDCTVVITFKVKK